jgi:hypothetical protein
VPVAENWVRALDAGGRDALWDATSELTKMRFEQEERLKLWLGSRAPLGKIVSRRLELSWSRDPEFLQGVPDGTYWEISFQCEFENKREVFEELLLHWEEGQWRIVAMWLN